MLLFGVIIFPYRASAINVAIKKKYPDVLLTDDYGVLKETDLAAYTWGMRVEHFSKKSTGINYWQCFPVSAVTIRLIDQGYSDKYIASRENLADLNIMVQFTKDISHEYVMPGYAGISDYKKLFNLWAKLLKDEKYVCIGGNFVRIKEEIKKEYRQTIYIWIFDKIKTKNGCDSRFYGYCNRTYREFMQEQADMDNGLKINKNVK